MKEKEMLKWEHEHQSLIISWTAEWDDDGNKKVTYVFKDKTLHVFKLDQ